MLQRKAVFHRPRNAENSEMKITNLHILMWDRWMAYVLLLHHSWRLPRLGSTITII